jgi:hypothetical protein
MEETDDEVDLRPRRPELRRYEDERGVSGEGDRERRFEPEPGAPMMPPGCWFEPEVTRSMSGRTCELE